jgi:hypothetical protein
MAKKSKKVKSIKKDVLSSSSSKSNSESTITQQHLDEAKRLLDNEPGSGAIFSAALDDEKQKATTMIEQCGGVVGIAKFLGVDLKSGIVDEKQAIAMREKYGENRLPEKRRKAFYECVVVQNR